MQSQESFLHTVRVASTPAALPDFEQSQGHAPGMAQRA
jgi:hypothetical protein